jgi:hypothetical protein
MSNKDEIELAQILKSKANKFSKPISNQELAKKTNKTMNRNRYDLDEIEEDYRLGSIQWTSGDGKVFFPAGKTLKKITPGFYDCIDTDRGPALVKINCKTEGLIVFPETHSEKVVSEIQNFWSKEEDFIANGLTYKRGIILWGPPGSGKSSTIQLILKDVITRGGIALKFNNPNLFVQCARMFRNIQPVTPLVVLMEDIDTIISQWGESEVLNILDGIEVIEKVVYLATTNYPENLGERLINRPSRFDRRFKMPHPSEASRKVYFEHLFKTCSNKIVESFDIDKWVSDTEDMSIAHLKELFIGVCIMGDPYAETIEVLKHMIEENITSKEDNKPNIGFKTYKNR